MSRRRISVKDLGAVDCQGWLHRKKESRTFLGSKWKRSWFVLKKSSLYWYSDKMAEKADGFINLSGFTIEQAKQCKRKHAITASHPQVVTIFIAAESFTEMNKWISKLSEAAEPCELINSEDCYSEGSDQDGEECLPSSSSLDFPLDAESENGNYLQPPCESVSCASLPSCTALMTESRSRSTSAGSTLSRNQRRRRPVSEGGSRLSWLDLPKPVEASGTETPPLLDVREEKEQKPANEKSPDELETLYNHLKAASLSPIGHGCQRDFRASFIRRCRNDKINEKVHLLRILKSTLKDKESELLTLEQILNDPNLTAPTYREWRLSNGILLQEISKRSKCSQAPGGAAKLRRDSV